MHKLRTAKVKAGEDFIKLSLTFSLTINPASINKLNPAEAKIKISGEK